MGSPLLYCTEDKVLDAVAVVRWVSKCFTMLLYVQVVCCCWCFYFDYWFSYIVLENVFKWGECIHAFHVWVVEWQCFGAHACTKNDIQTTDALTGNYSKLSTATYVSMVVLHLHMEQKDGQEASPLKLRRLFSML